MENKSHAQRELELLVEFNKDPNNRPIVEEFIPEILALVDKFMESDQSGGSAPYASHAIADTVKKLCMFEPISPIMGTDDEWNDISEWMDTPTWQNNRCTSIFKDSNGIVTYGKAIVFKSQTGNYYGGSCDSNLGRITSTQCIKSLPFEPKTFIVDVFETGDDGDWTFELADESQLNEVFEYYDLKVWPEQNEEIED